MYYASRSLAVVVLLLFVLPLPALSQTLVSIEGLGSISFPNTGAPGAQNDFVRGVLLLHSFEYEQAAAAFREAQKTDPDFAMAYWGEAMTYNHSLWRDKNETAARNVLERLPESALQRASARELAYLDAVRSLYESGKSKSEQDLAYLEAMQRLNKSYPDDDEGRAFYALAILGSRDGERDFATYMRAAAVALTVFNTNPDHPGAAHYIIHSFDDPVHAPLGLPAANAYSEIAPSAAHAQHMTSHIFLALGMWDRVVAANIRAQSVQDGLRAEQGLPPNACGHYSSWLHYGRLMEGDLDEAEILMNACHESISSGNASFGAWGYFVVMRARHIMDTENWALAERWKAEPPRVDREWIAGSASIFGGPLFTYRFTNAFAALRAGNETPARQFLEEDWLEHPGRTIQLKQLSGLVRLVDGEAETALSLLAEASRLEDDLPFEYGPPDIAKPSSELLGQILSSLGRYDAAVVALRHAVERTPGRPLAVRSLAAAREAMASR